MRVLGLDLATNIGFAIGELGGDPIFGGHRLPDTGADLGRFLIAFEDWLVAVLDREAPARVFFEAPILSQSTMTARKLMCLAGETERICVRRGLPVFEVVISQAKKFIAGHGYADKQMVVEAARARGWKVTNDNEADACAIWLYGCATLAPKVILPALAIELPDRVKQAREQKRQRRLAAKSKPKGKRKAAARRRGDASADLFVNGEVA
jgi:Holliday junction resolvasome RuvABC endonuclease subunit